MRIDVGRVTLHCEVAGEGPPILLSHGVIENSASWADLVPFLTRHHLVVTYDARGRGRSTGDDLAFGYAELAADVEGLATQLGLERFYHAGHSMGARVALEHALAYPGRVRGLALISGRATAPDEAGTARLAELAELVQRQGSTAGVALWARPGEHVFEQVRAISAGNPRDGTVTALRVLIEMDDLTPQLGGVGVPTLAVVGDGDETYVASTRSMTHAIPTAKMQVLQGVGHFPNLEQPELLAELLSQHALSCWRDDERSAVSEVD